MKHKVIIDSSKCIACGLCVKDCPMEALTIEGGASVKFSPCLYCGHCVAICPKEAVGITGFKDLPEPALKENLDSDLLLHHYKSRRSIRHFKKEPIDERVVDKIIEAGRYTPTGKNIQDVSFIILNHEKAKFEKLALKPLRRFLVIYQFFSKKQKGFSFNEDFLFKKAPLVLVVVSKNTVNGALAAANMALMAESLGLGVLYSGFFAVASKFSSALRKSLGLKKGEKVVTALVLGYPELSYQRTAQREEAKVKIM